MRARAKNMWNHFCNERAQFFRKHDNSGVRLLVRHKAVVAETLQGENMALRFAWVPCGLSYTTFRRIDNLNGSVFTDFIFIGC